MPISYFWPVSAASGGSGVPVTSAGVGTGVDGRRPYAFARRMDPADGDAVFDASRRSWARGAPIMERVLRCLRVERGAAMRDPSYGVDWSTADNERANAGAAAQQAVRTALQRFVDRGELSRLRVEVDVLPQAGARALALRLTFEDARGAQFAAQGRRA